MTDTIYRMTIEIDEELIEHVYRHGDIETFIRQQVEPYIEQALLAFKKRYG